MIFFGYQIIFFQNHSSFCFCSLFYIRLAYKEIIFFFFVFLLIFVLFFGTLWLIWFAIVASNIFMLFRVHDFVEHLCYPFVCLASKHCCCCHHLLQQMAVNHNARHWQKTLVLAKKKVEKMK